MNEPIASYESSPFPGHRIRVLSYNVQVGIPTSRARHYLTHSWKHVLPHPGRQRTLGRVANFISAFDIVGLQELDAGSLRSNFLNLAEWLSENSGMNHWYSQTTRNFGRLAKHSLGLLSRFPLRAVREHRLPGAIPGRGALEVHLGWSEKPLVVIEAHLALVRRTRLRQLSYIAELVQEHEHVIVMGDFNCQPASPEFRHLLSATALCEPHLNAPTHPSWQPLFSLDHILVTPELKVEHGSVYQVPYSDHLPIGLDLVLPDSLRLDFHPSEAVLHHEA